MHGWRLYHKLAFLKQKDNCHNRICVNEEPRVGRRSAGDDAEVHVVTKQPSKPKKVTSKELPHQPPCSANVQAPFKHTNNNYNNNNKN